MGYQDIGYTAIAALPGDNPLWGGTTTKQTNPNYKDTQEFIQAAPTSMLLSTLRPIFSYLLTPRSVPDDWTHVGCIAEVTDGSGRALPSATLISLDSMTPTTCMTFCSSKGHSIAGTECSSRRYPHHVFLSSL